MTRKIITAGEIVIGGRKLKRKRNTMNPRFTALAYACGVLPGVVRSRPGGLDRSIELEPAPVDFARPLEARNPTVKENHAFVRVGAASQTVPIDRESAEANDR